ncbi:NUDIX hydrolase, conserved [Trypanosoma brucei gambiense DAL972]|uniref:NUDIX hydrolase, conserved n=2 Tax=Trypanosoma brucei TaxID=5691 RepID=D0A2J1_TRYB9|nr:NUDIX hydrolase, conserved [Trypanosoma brucei gambiense DAL972]RHW69463.1 Mutt-Nudix-related hydrolase 5 [Trypanosoma brucei equiperdum]CBH15485.1 NUDIX hydrolase, conserved [Trypanosoma brucei gambiense DAL972]|eukprot:XP_011777749.1 NUDIX hydrolase, conserved [Trypanosoma brucei gambiense DAL972]
MAMGRVSVSSLPSNVSAWVEALQRALHLKVEDLHLPEHFHLKNLSTGCRFSHLNTPPTVGDKRESAVLVLLSPAAGMPPNTFQEMCVTLTKRTPHLRHHKGEMSFPGGRLDGEEQAAAAAQRETAEEIGIDSSLYEILGPLRPLAPLSGKSHVTPIVAVTQCSVTPLCHSPHEVDSIHYLHLSPLLLNSKQTHCRLLKYLPSSSGVPLHFPCFFTSPSQARYCDPVSPSPGLLQLLQEDGGHEPLLPNNFPGELVWGVTAFVMCELLVRLITALGGSGTALGCSPAIARDPEHPLGKR